jgi:hypothetical protein
MRINPAFSIISILFIGALVVFAASCSKKIDNEKILKAYLKSHNTHNIESEISLFHKDATFVMYKQQPITDIRKLVTWDASIKSNLNYKSWEVKGDTIIVGKIVEKNNWFSHAGIPKIIYKPGTRFVFKDGKIFEIRVSEMTEESVIAVNDMFSQFMNWAFEHYPEKLNELMPNGQFDFSIKKAETWFKLMDEWQLSK